MITRFPGLTPTRSRAVVHDGLVFTVAVSPDPEPDFYQQTRQAFGGSTKAWRCRHRQKPYPVGAGLHRRHRRKKR